MHSVLYGLALLAVAVLHAFAYGARVPELAERTEPTIVVMLLLWLGSTAIMVLCALRLMGIYIL